MKWYERLTRIDRRLIYCLLTIFLILPFFVPFSIPQNIMPQTQRMFDFVESIPLDGKVVIVAFDYTPQTMPECHPMAIALLTHCFSRGIPVVGLSFDIQAPGLAVEALADVTEKFNRHALTHEDSLIYGEDYVYLGWKSGFTAAVLDMGESIAGVFPRDYFNNDVNLLPLMQKTRNYKDVAIVMSLAAAAWPEYWVLYPQSRYGVKVGAGLTAVMAPQYYPFLQTGQFSGMIAGMKGAAEYEYLIKKHGYTKKLGAADTGMNSQSIVHLLIILFIVMGNIGFFFSRRKNREGVGP